MTNIHLISSILPSYQNNTRTSFENVIPHCKDLKYVGLCLKELYFQASFVTINKQDHPHIVFIVKLDSNVIEENVEDESEKRKLVSTYRILEESQEYKKESRSINTSFDFGIVKKIIFAHFCILEVVLHPARIEKSSELVSIFNHILTLHYLIDWVKFYEVKETNKLEYKTSKCVVLFDNHFANFLGYLQKKRTIFSHYDLEFVYQTPVRDYLTKLIEHGYCFNGLDFSLLNLEKSEQFHQTLTADKDLNLLINTPSRVLVICDSVEPQIYKTKLIRYLGILNLISSHNSLKNYQKYTNSAQLIHYQPVQPLFLPVKSDNIQSVKIILQEENQKILSLSTAGPTLATLKTTLNPKMNCHCLVFTSSNDRDGLELFPNNKAGRFQHQLPKEIKLKELNLGVEVISVSLPKRMFNITNPFNIIDLRYEPKKGHDNILAQFIMNEMNKDKTIFNIFSESAIPPSISIKTKYYQNLSELVDINYELFFSAGIRIEEQYNRIIFHNISTENNIIMQMSNGLAMLLGLTAQISEDYFHFVLSTTFVAPYKTKINMLAPDYVLVYADFIEDSIIGGIMAPVLKVVPTPSSDEKAPDRMYYDFQGERSAPVCKDILTTFVIELRDVSGRILEFESEEYTEILLAFKEK